LPLCGKTLDIHWLLSNGYRAAGSELSEVAVKQLFSELVIEPKITAIDDIRRHSADNIDISTPSKASHAATYHYVVTGRWRYRVGWMRQHRSASSGFWSKKAGKHGQRKNATTATKCDVLNAAHFAGCVGRRIDPTPKMLTKDEARRIAACRRRGSALDRAK
jgi:hypothetical protein